MEEGYSEFGKFDLPWYWVDSWTNIDAWAELKNSAVKGSLILLVNGELDQSERPIPGMVFVEVVFGLGNVYALYD